MNDQLDLNLPEPTDKARVLSTLARFAGADKGVHVAQLAFLVQLSERQVRKLVSELREEGVAICATPETGYFIAKTPEELDECCQFLRGRALHSLHLEASLRRIPLPDLLGQLKLNT